MEFKQLIDSIAFYLHENWREGRKNEDGSYQNDWKPIEDDKYIIRYSFGRLPDYVRQVKGGKFEIDRTNAPYNRLPSNLQKEVKEFATVLARVADVEKYKGSLSPSQAGKLMHGAWLRMHGNKLTNELNVDFDSLPKEVQKTYLDHYKVAFEMSLAKDATIYVGNTLDDICKYLMIERIKGNNIYYEGFGKILFSKFDNEESCYLKVHGKTKGLVYAAQIEKEQREAQQKARQKAKIPSLIERGKAIIYPQRLESWKERVEDSVNGLFHGRDVEEALTIMEGLENGMSYDEANEIITKSGHSGGSYTCVMGTIINFSKKGPDFFRHISPSPLPYNREVELQAIERQNDYLKMREKEAAKTSASDNDKQL